MKLNFKAWFGLILILAAVIRFSYLDGHYLIASDTARDLLTARGALASGELPWVGSFSSAGPFVFGPNWYWFLMLPSIIAPNFFLAPWVTMTFVSLLFVLVMGLCGRVIGGKKLGLICALVTAVSPISVGFSAYLAQHGLIEIFSALALLGTVLYLRTGKLIFGFLMGAAIGGGFSMHYQAINLFLFIPAAFFGAIWQRRTLKEISGLVIVSGLGFLIFPLPLFLWDATRNFKNIEQVIYYFRVGQYRFWVSNRWLTYLGVFWPEFLGKMAGGSYLFGWFLGLITSLALIYQTIRKKLTVELVAVGAVLVGQIILLRYLRSERLEGYLVYFHPTLLLIVSWGLLQLINFKRFLGGLALFVIVIASLKACAPLFIWHNDIDRLFKVSQIVREKYPDEKVVIYGHGLATCNVSYSLSLVLDYLGFAGEQGRPVGVCLGDINGCKEVKAVEIASDNFQKENFIVTDLSNLPIESLTKEKGWYPFSKVAVYDDVQNWWKKEIL